MLSIGTGSAPLIADSASTNDSISAKCFRMRKQPGFLSNWRHLFRILVNNMELALDCDRIWDDYYNLAESSTSGPSKRHFRINPTLPGTSLPALDDVDSMTGLQSDIKKFLVTEPQIFEVARQLVASSFYFDLSSIEEGLREKSKVKGMMTPLPDSFDVSPLQNQISVSLTLNYRTQGSYAADSYHNQKS